MRLRHLCTLTITAFLLLGNSTTTPLRSYAQGAESLSAFEQQIFSRDYASDALPDRLNRLESVVFGQAQQGDPASRQRALERIFESNEKASPEAQAATGSAQPPQPQEPPQKDITDYPAVTQMEEQRFKKHYKNEPIQNRLSRLEQDVFRQRFSELPLVDRVDQLALKLNPQGPLGREESFASPGLPNNPSEFLGGGMAVYSELTTLEERVLGRDHGGELISDRISRLEHRVFGGPQSGNVDDRLAKLNNEVFSPQRQQVGSPQAYTPQHPGLYQGRPDSPLPQHAAIGGGINGRQFSPEMMEMLPQNVRQQLNTPGMQGSSASSGQVQVYTGPSTWQQNTQMHVSPGWGQPMPFGQNRHMLPPANPYGAGMFATPQRSQVQMRMAPYGSSSPVIPNQNPMQPSVPYGMNAPMYPTQPQFFRPGIAPGFGVNNNGQLVQSLMVLENSVFGQTYANRTVTDRLGNLESQVFGRQYPFETFEQRVQRLMMRSGMPQSQGLPIDGFQTGNSTTRNVLGQALNMLMMRQNGMMGVPYGVQQPYYGAW